jgi:hypothetical protein
VALPHSASSRVFARLVRGRAERERLKNCSWFILGIHQKVDGAAQQHVDDRVRTMLGSRSLRRATNLQRQATTLIYVCVGGGGGGAGKTRRSRRESEREEFVDN